MMNAPLSAPGFFLDFLLLSIIILLLLHNYLLNQRIQRKLFETRVVIQNLKMAHEQSKLRQMQLKKKKDNVEQTVDLSTKAVETVHRSITDITFSVIDSLAKRGRTKETAKKIQNAHDQAVGGVYNSIREVNKQVSELTNILLKADIKPQSTRINPAKEKPVLKQDNQDKLS